MKIFISETDRHNAFRAAIWNIAKVHKIDNSDYKTNKELYDEIVEMKSPILPALNDYLNAYNKWFGFYQSKKKTEQESGNEYHLNDKERNELAALMTARQTNLENLQKQFDQLK
ncbi:MAG: hypothetical protein WC223_09260 [Bacteroidales bacterium]|jgi:hypothetical protein